MAKNYTIKEAVEIIVTGTDLESIADIGRRYPVLLQKVATIGAKAGEEFVDFMGFMPEYLTANKVNTAIKNAIVGGTEDTDGEEDTDAETGDDAEDAGETTAQWDESMSAKQLWDILGKAGKRKLAKSTKKADLVDACKKAFGNAAATEEVEAEDDAEESTNPYDGKSAMELFKECKKRGIKAAPKKAAKFYADLLVEDDAKAADTETEDVGEEDWGDEPAEEPKKTPAKKAAPKKAAKVAKKEEADDEGDDWDI